MFSLVLGGWGAKWYIHLGVYKYLIEHHLVPHDIVGTSMGAIMGVMISLGWTTDRIYDEIKRFALYKIVGLPTSYGVIPHHKVKSYLKDLFGNQRIEDLPIPLTIITYDINSGSKQTLRHWPLIDALMASARIPGIFAPTSKKNDSLIFDGGIGNNLDCEEAQRDQIIAISTSGASSPLPDKANVALIGLRSLTHLLRHNEDLSILRTQHFQGKTITLIRPDLSSYEMYHFDKYDELIAIGYKEMEKVTESSKK